MLTTVALEGVEFFAYHGFYPEERKNGNYFILDVKVSLKHFDSNEDDIHDTVNYESLYEICKTEMKKTRKLLESVVFSIIKTIQAKHPEASGAYVRLAKKNPPLGGQVDQSVIEMSY